MPQFSFGSGYLYAIPSGANPTPVLFGTLQDVTLDISFTIKRLMGQFQSPVAVARGPSTYTGKAKAASISSQAFNTIFTGQASLTGGLLVANNEVHSVAAGAATVSNVPVVDDLGVTYTATNVPLIRVASAPALGQYSLVLATGVYTFNSGDNGTNNVQISYTYNTATAPQQNITYANQLMGSAPVFSMVLNVPFNQFNTSITYKFYQCISTKLTMDFKNEDFTVPQFDFEAYANPAGNVYQATFSS